MPHLFILSCEDYLYLKKVNYNENMGSFKPFSGSTLRLRLCCYLCIFLFLGSGVIGDGGGSSGDTSSSVKSSSVAGEKNDESSPKVGASSIHPIQPNGSNGTPVTDEKNNANSQDDK